MSDPVPMLGVCGCCGANDCKHGCPTTVYETISHAAPDRPAAGGQRTTKVSFQHKDPTKAALPKMVGDKNFPLGTDFQARPFPPTESPGCGFTLCQNGELNVPQCKDWFGTDADQYNLTNPPPVQQFTQDGTLDLSGDCRGQFHKSAWAMRSWHGKRGYISSGKITAVKACFTDGVFSHYELIRGFKARAPQTKYTRITATAQSEDITGTGAGCHQPHDLVTATKSASVDAQSGVVTTNGSNDFDHCSGLVPAAPNPELNFHWADWNIDDWLNDFVNSIPSLAGTAGSNITDAGFEVWFNNGFGTEIRRDTASWNIAGGTFTHVRKEMIRVNCDDTGGDIYAETLRRELTISETEMTYTETTTADGSYKVVKSVTCTLSGENTSDSVLADAYVLLALFKLSKMPWRKNGYLNVAPVAMRNEVGVNVEIFADNGFTPVEMPDPNHTTPIPDSECREPSDPAWIPTYAPIPWVDPNAKFYDGSILGELLPDGYIAATDLRAITEGFCCNNPAESPNPAQYFDVSRGERNAQPFGIPANATRWLDARYSLNKAPGAFIQYYDRRVFGSNMLSPDAFRLVVGKYCEAKIQLPSENYARPAGMDRFAWDESKVVFIKTGSSAGSGSGATFTSADFQDNETIIPDASGIWIIPAMDGAFEISVVGSLVTVGTKRFNLPSDWDAKTFGEDKDIALAPMRWPTAPAILGKVAITANNEMPVRIQTQSPLTTLGLPVGSSDAVDFLDVDGTVILGNQIVTRVDDSNFTVPTVFALIQNAKFICSAGINAAFNSNKPKGDVVSAAHTWNIRALRDAQRANALRADPCVAAAIPETPLPPSDIGVADIQQHNIPLDACAAGVLVIAPPGQDEDFPNMVKVDMPTKIDLDEEDYGGGNGGTRWQATWHQAMPSLFWQQPHKPGGIATEDFPNFRWNMANVCDVDLPPDYFYPHWLPVEARCDATPANYGNDGNQQPVLFSGISFPTYGPLDPIGCDIACTALASGTGNPNEMQTIEMLVQAMSDCVKVNGRFAQYYLDYHANWRDAGI